MMKRRVCLGLAAIVCASAVVRADSPLTSTDLAKAYAELPAVKEAISTKQVAGAVLRVLLGTEPNDRKAAVVNALGWQTPGLALAFLSAVAEARRIPVEDVKLAHLTSADRFVLGYLRAMETYVEPSALRPGALDVWGATPIGLLDQASLALPDDFAVHYVRALVDAQRLVADSSCSAYLATQRVIDRFPVSKRNLRPAAVASAQEYMSLLKANCDIAPKNAPPSGRPAALSVEHNQIYRLARLGDTIVAGTQAGITVWTPNQSQPIASRNEQICTTVLTWRDVVWAGCYGTVVRWDGKAWKGYLQDPTLTDSAFVPLLGPAGDLLVRNGARAWRYDSGRDTFVPHAISFGDDPYDVLFRRNGDLWRIDFLRAVVGPGRAFAIGSAEYAGSDPRRLIEDTNGRLWVADFDNGLFQLDVTGTRFERHPAFTDAGAAVAVDPARGRTWLLHYTKGPVLHEGERLQPFTFSALEDMRDLLVDERTGEVWIAGWTGLLRVRQEQGTWKSVTFRVGGRR